MGKNSMKWMAAALAAALLAGTPSVPAMAEEAQMEPGTGEVVTIWECNWGGENYEAALNKLAEEATAANIDGKGYKVEVSMVGWDNYYETFMTAALAGTAPDIAWQATYAPFEFADMGVTLDLQPIYDAWVEEGSPVAAEIPESAWTFSHYNDQLVGIPVAIGGRSILYNKTIFEEAGVEKVPETWDEFLDTCQKLKDYGTIPLVFRGDAPFMAGITEFFMFSNNTGAVTDEYESLVMSDANQEVYHFISDLYTNEYIPKGILGYTQTDTDGMFINGEAAMLLSGNSATIDDKEEFGVIPPLMGPSADKLMSGCATQSYFAFNQGGHDEATLAVMKWWVENNDILYTEGNNMNVPSWKTQRERVINNRLVNETSDLYFGESAYIGYYPLTSFSDFTTAFDSAGINGIVPEAVFSGGDVDEAIQQTETEMQELLADFQ